MSDPKLHHFVPRFYLRRFADDSEQILVRTRDGGSFTTSTRNVMARTGLYSVPNKPLTAERILGDFESSASAALEEICSLGRLPATGTEGRTALTLLMSLQLARSPDSAEFIDFAHDAIDAIGEVPVSEDGMRLYLEREVLGFVPQHLEVQAACDLVNYQARQPDFPDRAAATELRMQLMFDLSLKSLAPHISARAWSLEASRTAEFITSDRPATLWHPPSDKDWYQGVGITDAEEIWFPIDPTRMLVLRRFGPERIRRVGPERVQFVNEHMARHCSKLIAAHPLNKDAPGLRLARRRPVMRFFTGPLYVDGSPQPKGDVLHFWKPIRDIPDDWTEPWLNDSSVDL